LWEPQKRAPFKKKKIYTCHPPPPKKKKKKMLEKPAGVIKLNDLISAD